MNPHAHPDLEQARRRIGIYYIGGHRRPAAGSSSPERTLIQAVSSRAAPATGLGLHHLIASARDPVQPSTDHR